jgi:hypothetical protein
MPNRLTNFTLFFMVYGEEVMLPTELQYRSPRVQAYQSVEAEQAWQDALNLLEESRDVTITRSAGYQQMLQRFHARKVDPWAFQVGNLVLWWVQTKKGKHKLSPPWKGPYLVVEVLQLGAHWLQEINGATFPNAWNIEQLRKLYP